jgi:hypothetical protein
MEITINVSKAVSIPDLVSRQRDLKVGSHIIDDSLLGHWYLKSLQESGVLTIVTKKTPKSQDNYKSLEQIREIEKNEKQVQTIVVTGPKVPESMQEPELVIHRVSETKEAISIPVVEKEPEPIVVKDKLVRRKRK